MSEREDLLRKLVAGDIEADDPALEALSLEDPSLRHEVAELLELVRGIDSAAQSARADKQMAAQMRLESREALVERAIRGLASGGERSASTSARGRQWWVRAAIGAAAAILVLFAWHPWTPARNASPGPRFLGGGGLTLIAPVGRVGDFDEFHWEADDARARWFEIAVYAERGEHELYRARDLRETRWRPGPADLEHWPDEIRWQVIAYDPSGNAVGTAEQHAQR